VDLQAYFRVKRPTVVSEIIDGEAVVINLDKGIYYSMEGSGAVIWSRFEAGAVVQQIIDDLCKQYTGDSADIRTVLCAFVEQLVNEDLITSGVPVQTAAPNGKSSTDTPTYPKPDFVSPLLQKFTDMEALLLLDPIHDVTEQGWPTLPENAEN
jgi:hypothetical protein